ncbi:hypothetical protein DPMN_172902 [Dreissena polymorpha]|uniref:Uncharacterized protein n=1 Tax=Dreissena polymorpha TaxID=45954 RepID=A0A9D4IGG8_DREPO|nr:hypothetical protein DPMN_172902 [Dreissena polymorpha]
MKVVTNYGNLIAGFFDIVKDITTHRNGTVLIRTAYLDEEKKVYRHFSQECQLFISDTK